MIAERILIFAGTICSATLVCFGIGYLIDRAAIRARDRRDLARRPVTVTREIVINGRTIHVIGPPPADTFGSEWMQWVNDFPTFKGKR